MDKEIIQWGIGILAPALGATFIGIVHLYSRISRLEGKWETFVTLFGNKAAKVLHSPHTPALDDLLEKYEISNLNAEEITRLRDMLSDIENNNVERKSDRLAASILLLSMQQRYGGAH